MNPVQRIVVVVWLGWGWLCHAQTMTVGQGVEVVMYELPETLWQAEFEGQFQENPALCKRLEAAAEEGRIQRPLSSQLRFSAEGTAVYQKGAEQAFVTGWDADTPEEVKPFGTLPRFIGTRMEVQDEGLTDSGKQMVIVKLEHHLAPPAMYKINYANAATGAERERLSVEYPQFEKLEWEGRLSIWHLWRLVVNVHRPAGEAPAMRYLVFIKRC